MPSLWTYRSELPEPAVVPTRPVPVNHGTSEPVACGRYASAFAPTALKIAVSLVAQEETCAAPPVYQGPPQTTNADGQAVRIWPNTVAAWDAMAALVAVSLCPQEPT